MKNRSFRQGFLVFSIFQQSALTLGCREEHYVIVTPPREGDRETFVIDSELGSFFLDVNFPEKRLSAVAKARFHLILDIENKEIVQMSASADEVSAYIPMAPNREGPRRISVNLVSNARYPYMREISGLDFSEERLSNLPIGVLRVDQTDWWLLPKQSRCTGFLVAPNLVVTNNHCIEDQLECRRTEIQFWNYKEGWFKRNFGTSEFQCKNLLFTDFERDQSLIEIEGDASFYGQFPISRRAHRLKKDEIFRISTMSDSFFSGIFREHRQCVLENEGRLLDSGSGKTFLESYCDKPIEGGNSGSPVFDSEGYVFGVLWGRLAVDGNIALFNPLHPRLIRMIHERSR
ncbi:MAG: trypsin-like serine peptidase [Bdellovibrionota bacterium]